MRSDAAPAARRAAAQRVKRLLDAGVGSLLFVATLPVQLATAGVVAATLGRPVLFTQERPGRDGRLFRLRKFRSMAAPRYPGEPDADRLTPVGYLLRATSLDELPSLWNVVVGDMSFVGPRPLLTEYLSLYSPRQARRHEVRPGVTGLAQVSGRNAVAWDDRLELDVRYVETWSLALDVWILARTVALVLRRTGIAAPGEATMARFRGPTSASAQESRDGVVNPVQVVLVQP